MTRFAGSTADGLLVHPFTSRRHVDEHTLANLATGLRDGHHDGRGLLECESARSSHFANHVVACFPLVLIDRYGFKLHSCQIADASQ